jgi:hypothetical protein
MLVVWAKIFKRLLKPGGAWLNLPFGYFHVILRLAIFQMQYEPDSLTGGKESFVFLS